VVGLSNIGSTYTVGERENLSFHIEEDSLPSSHGISLADAAHLLKVLFLKEGALAMGVACDTGYDTRCPRGDGETPSWRPHRRPSSNAPREGRREKKGRRKRRRMMIMMKIIARRRPGV
jgi:hypothetical protein